MGLETREHTDSHADPHSVWLHQSHQLTPDRPR
ncbi:Uncharacterised protein [Vibrio cholerae]|nr:Uncharacterised protein [Vibrio cholerae]CSH87759.1 Uncharacterised protein [Vibrio cholerae]